MRKTLLIILLLTALTACKKHELASNDDAKTKYKPNYETAYFDNQMLVFENQEHFETYLNLVLSQGKHNISSTSEFTSMKELYDNALAKFNVLQSKEDYISYKAIYSAYFVFNENDDMDLNPYPAVENRLYMNVINERGYVKIGDSIHNFKTITKFEDSFYYKSAQLQQTKGNIENINYLHIDNGSRKIWAEALRNGAQTWISFTAQVKHWLWGWNVHDETYCTKLIVMDAYEHDEMGWSQLGDEVSQSLNTERWTREIGANYNILIGIQTAAIYRPDYIFYTPLRRTYRIYSASMGSGESGILTINI